MGDVRKIVLTGGPCAGKTSIISVLSDKERIGGRRLLLVPESATQLFSEHRRSDDVEAFQSEVMDRQLASEAAAVKSALELGEPAVVICDRGLADGSVYCSKQQFANIMEKHHLDWDKLFARYDAVIHLVSAAVEAPAVYSSANNVARFEGLDEAALNEERTLSAWKKHPNHHVVGRYSNFDKKTQETLRLIEQECLR